MISRRDVGLERGVVVGQIGKGVVSHGGVCLLWMSVVVSAVTLPERRGCQPGSANHPGPAGGRALRFTKVSTDPKDRWRDLGSFIREQRGTARLSLRRLSELAGISNRI